MKHSVNLIPEDDTFNHLLTTQKTILFFGAGLYLQPSLLGLQQKNNKPSAVIDNNQQRWGEKIKGITILSPENALALYPNAIVIITSAPEHISSIRKQLISLNTKHIYDASLLLSSLKYNKDSFLISVSSMHFEFDKYFYKYFLFNHPDTLVLKTLDIVITEKCSLKCKDCSNLMQFYTAPKDIDIDILFNALDELMSSIDHVMEFRVLGGEAFLHKKMHAYVNRLRQYSNYTRIVVYSNGTIIPKSENLNCLMFDDTYIRISDYGDISKNTPKIVETLDANNITYNLEEVTSWQDCAVIEKRERTERQLESIYSSCCAKDTLTLLNNALYICPFTANAENIGALPNVPDETIILDHQLQENQIKQQLFSMLRNKKHFSACQYCAGRPDEGPPLQAAVQVKKPMPYKKFTH